MGEAAVFQTRDVVLNALHVLPVPARDCPTPRYVPLVIGSSGGTISDRNKEHGECSANIETCEYPIPFKPIELVVTTSAQNKRPDGTIASTK